MTIERIRVILSVKYVEQGRYLFREKSKVIVRYDHPGIQETSRNGLTMEELWRKAKENEESAILKILDRTEKSIYAAIYKYVWVREDVEDLYQDGVELVLRAIIDYEPAKGVPFLAYVHTKLKYHYMNENNKRVVVYLDEPIGDGLTLADTLISDSDTEEIISRNERAEEVHRALQTLTDRERKCVYGFYFLRMSIGELAESQNIAYRTAYNAKCRGLKKLQSALVNFRSETDRVV